MEEKYFQEIFMCRKTALGNKGQFPWWAELFKKVPFLESSPF